jgi:DNA-binding beta-propeller fold protein YncE
MKSGDLGRTVAVFFAVVAIGLGSLSAHWGDRDQDSDDTIWVINRDPVAGPGTEGDLTVFHADTGEAVVSLFPLGVGAHDIAISPRFRRAFITNETDSTVSVLSTSTLEPIGTIQFPATFKPHHIETSWDGKTVHVGLFGTNRVAIIDARTLDVREYASSPAAGPLAHAPRTSRDDRRIFVPHENVNLLTKLSARTGVPLGSLTLGTTANSGPSEVLPTHDGERLFVSMRNEGKVRIVDTDSFTDVGDISVGTATQPESLILTPDERTLIVSLRGSPAQLALVNVRKKILRGTIQIGGPGTFGDLAVASPDGRYVYATFDATALGTGGVAKVDLHKYTVETWLYPRIGRPHGIAYSTTKLRSPTR